MDRNELAAYLDALLECRAFPRLLPKRPASGRSRRGAPHRLRRDRQPGFAGGGAGRRCRCGAGASRLVLARRGRPRHRHPPRPPEDPAGERPQPVRLPPAAGCPCRVRQQRAAGAPDGLDGGRALRRAGRRLSRRTEGTRRRGSPTGWRSKLGRLPLLVGDPARRSKRIAWCSGGAQGYFEQAIAAGADAYVSGEISEQTVHLAQRIRRALHRRRPPCHRALRRAGARAPIWRSASAIECRYVDIDNPAGRNRCGRTSCPCLWKPGRHWPIICNMSVPRRVIPPSSFVIGGHTISPLPHRRSRS
jgi:hypothetical protein